MKNRHKIVLFVILILATFIFLLHILPIGDGNWNKKQIQKINSIESSDNFCFAVMGDNKNGFNTFHKIIKKINNKKPLFAIDVGDLVFDDEKEKYRLFYNEIKKSEVPFLVAIGNHEILEGDKNRYLSIFGNLYYSFSYNNSLFIVLDDANEEYIDKPQMKFLENELKKDFKYKFVFMHVPPFDPRDYTLDILGLVHKNIKPEHSLSNKENAEQFMNLVSKYNVTTVFNSHIHGYFNETREGTHYIITGGAGGELLLSDPKHYFYHYVNVCINNGDVNYEIVKFPSPNPNIIDRFGYSIWLYSWYFVITHKWIIILGIIILVLIIDLTYIPLKKLKLKLRNINKLKFIILKNIKDLKKSIVYFINRNLFKGK